MFLRKKGRRYNVIDPTRKDMYKKLYLSGLPLAEIGRTLGGVVSRTVYHHLQPISPDEKAVHMRNLSIRKDAEREEKRKAKENV